MHDLERRVAALETTVQELQEMMAIAQDLFSSIGLKWEKAIRIPCKVGKDDYVIESIPGLTGGGGGK